MSIRIQAHNDEAHVSVLKYLQDEDVDAQAIGGLVLQVPENTDPALLGELNERDDITVVDLPTVPVPGTNQQQVVYPPKDETETKSTTTKSSTSRSRSSSAKGDK